jgi:hypothetical protein
MAKHASNDPTHEILLRDVTEDDLPIFFEQQLDPDATKMAAFPARDRNAFMGHWTKIMSDGTVVLKTILFEVHVAGNVVSWEQSAERRFTLIKGEKSAFSAFISVPFALKTKTHPRRLISG